MSGPRATGVVLLAALALAAWWFWPSEERRVRARIEALAEAASLPVNESDLARVARIASLAQGLHAEVEVVQGDGSTLVTGRDALLGFASRLSSLSEPFRIEVDGIDLAIDEDGAHATAAVTVSVVRLGADGPSARSDEPSDVQEAHLELTRVDDEWAVSRIEAQGGPIRPPAAPR